MKTYSTFPKNVTYRSSGLFIGNHTDLGPKHIKFTMSSIRSKLPHKQENVTHNEEITQSLDMNPKLTQTLELGEKDMFKKVSRYMEDIKDPRPNHTSRENSLYVK